MFQLYSALILQWIFRGVEFDQTSSGYPSRLHSFNFGVCIFIFIFSGRFGSIFSIFSLLFPIFNCLFSSLSREQILFFFSILDDFNVCSNALSRWIHLSPSPLQPRWLTYYFICINFRSLFYPGEVSSASFSPFLSRLSALFTDISKPSKTRAQAFETFWRSALFNYLVSSKKKKKKKMVQLKGALFCTYCCWK